MGVVRAIDADGWPVLLADQEPPSRSSGDGSTSSASRRDLVRELAREFEDLSAQDIRERLPSSTALNYTASEISQIQQDVRRQVIDDLVDVLDQRHRGKLRARRTVRLTAPRGYVRKLVAGLSESEVVDVRARLSTRGWSPDDLRRVLPSRPADRRSQPA